MNRFKTFFSFVALSNIAIMAALMGCLFYSSFFNNIPIDPKKEGFIRTLEKEAKFFKVLAYRESSSKLDKINKFGYLGKYQFGEATLIGLGYYSKDNSVRNDWRGKWTGKHGILSKQDFMGSFFAQEMAVRELTSSNWAIAKTHKLDSFIGKTVHGTYVTREGILAAMHLKGPKSVNSFIFYGVNSRDALGTGVQEYMNLFSKI